MLCWALFIIQSNFLLGWSLQLLPQVIPQTTGQERRGRLHMAPPESRGKVTYLACQVEIRMVGQADWCGLTGLSSIVDHELPTVQRVCYPDFQLPRVTFLAIWTDPRELDAIWQHLRGPEDLGKKCVQSCLVIPTPSWMPHFHIKDNWFQEGK